LYGAAAWALFIAIVTKCATRTYNASRIVSHVGFRLIETNQLPVFCGASTTRASEGGCNELQRVFLLPPIDNYFCNTNNQDQKKDKDGNLIIVM
jgi:hypothetical protein